MRRLKKGKKGGGREKKRGAEEGERQKEKEERKKEGKRKRRQAGSKVESKEYSCFCSDRSGLIQCFL